MPYLSYHCWNVQRTRVEAITEVLLAVRCLGHCTAQRVSERESPSIIAAAAASRTHGGAEVVSLTL